MSWKSIELQVAIPRTTDAGKLQDQMLKQPQHTQSLLTEHQLKMEEQKRKRINDLEHTRKIVKKNDSQSNHQTDDKSEREPEANRNTNNHPYLGLKVDFNG